MLQETRDKGRKIKTDRGELDIYRMCFTSEETEARSGKVAYRVMHTVELGGKTMISFSALGTYCVGGTAEGVKQRARERQTHREIKRHTEKSREEHRHRARENQKRHRKRDEASERS